MRPVHVHVRAVGVVAVGVAVVLSLGGGRAVAQVAPWDLLAPRPTSGDSPRACAALAAAERARMARTPLTEVDVYRSMGDAFGTMAALRWSAVLPTVGVHLQRDSRTPGLALSWSYSLPFGPVTACRSGAPGDVQEFRSLRLVLEPGLVVRRPVSAFLRPGVRGLWHPSGARIGVGVGIGSTLAWIDAARVAASISPELVLHLGRCCRPGYLLFTVRADRYLPRREPDTLIANVSLAFW